MPNSLKTPERSDRVKINRWIRTGITTAMIATAVALAIRAYRFYEYSPWTRDGRVRVYVVDTAPEVSGLVVNVPVGDNQFVHKGDVLYRIDPRDYQVCCSPNSWTNRRCFWWT
jgi:multidrug resistance efflux pump